MTTCEEGVEGLEEGVSVAAGKCLSRRASLVDGRQGELGAAGLDAEVVVGGDAEDAGKLDEALRGVPVGSER